MGRENPYSRIFYVVSFRSHELKLIEVLLVTSCDTPLYFENRSALRDRLKIFANSYQKKSSFMSKDCVRILNYGHSI